jgi:hypothetical protein
MVSYALPSFALSVRTPSILASEWYGFVPPECVLSHFTKVGTTQVIYVLTLLIFFIRDVAFRLPAAVGERVEFTVCRPHSHISVVCIS